MNPVHEAGEAQRADGAAGPGEQAEHEQHGADHGDDRAEHERRVLIASNPSSGRIAATGGMQSGNAGTMTDSIVTPIPTMAAMITVDSSTVDVSGKPAPRP